MRGWIVWVLVWSLLCLIGIVGFQAVAISNEMVTPIIDLTAFIMLYGVVAWHIANIAEECFK